jgi:acetylornithine deacetylase
MDIRPIARDLAALVAMPSVSSRVVQLDNPNRPVIDWLAGRLAALGFRISIEEIAGAHGKANLVASLGSGAPGFILAGHTDTVPCEPGLWQTDPFALSERDGRLHGLGTCDMKGFFALLLAALAEVQPARLRSQLVVLATSDEETSMAGARALAGSFAPRAPWALIGEPTSMRPARLHKGIVMMRIRVVGRSGHSSDPALGNNALEGMQRVMAALLAWRSELQARRRDERFGVPVTTLNLGRIAGGDSPNRICGACELDIDVRPVPGVRIAALHGELRERVAHALAGTGLTVDYEPIFDGIDALDTAAGAAVVRVAEELTGFPAGAVGFATEGPFLAELGSEVVILGPGAVTEAHQPNEFLEISRIEPMIGVLQGMIARFCA